MNSQNQEDPRKSNFIITKYNIRQIKIRYNLLSSLFLLTFYSTTLLVSRYFSFLIHTIFSLSLSSFLSPLISSFLIHHIYKTFSITASALCVILLPQDPAKRQDHHLLAFDAPWQQPPPGPGFILSHALRATQPEGVFASRCLFYPRGGSEEAAGAAGAADARY